MLITVKNIIDEDFSNFKQASMIIAFPICSFKCEKDCGIKGICQNTALYKSKNISIDTNDIIIRYLNNFLTNAIVFGGLEPLDSFDDVKALIQEFRQKTNDTIIIYTGYYPNEVSSQLQELKQYSNIIVKFGRFIPNQKPHYDEVLGIKLISDNQYAQKIS